MKTFFLTLISGSFALCNLAVAQKENGNGEFGMFQTQAEYHQFMGSVKQSPETAGMVDLVNDVVLGNPIGSTRKQYGGGGSTLGMLSDPEVRADLEMVDDQYEELQKLNSEIQDRAAEQLRGIDLTDRKNLVARIQQIRDQTERELNSLLLPHQTKRLSQIQAQSQLRRRSFVDIITSEPLRTEFEISDEQSKELKESEREIEEDLARQIAELRSRARERLLVNLRQSQKEKIDNLFGDMFETKQSKKSNPKKSKPDKEKLPK